jgi:hypothetical protein
MGISQTICCWARVDVRSFFSAAPFRILRNLLLSKRTSLGYDFVSFLFCCFYSCIGQHHDGILMTGKFLIMGFFRSVLMNELHPNCGWLRNESYPGEIFSLGAFGKVESTVRELFVGL